MAGLANRVGDQRRDQVAQQIETAYQAGQLDAREQAERVAASCGPLVVITPQAGDVEQLVERFP
ncbi:protein of unknown function (DUF1707) [Micromonospora viridifaciens]|uniref:DUF1707 domain-containing protein n=1 Tax=Micromonospora viridifaciens TaxID=1881 RepID=A0A1C4Y6Q7_MICVI|nr:protein of unknown function (DUF1707) [Micromonospora viridifaciens]